MRLITDGKTKTLYDLGDDRLLVVFKDDVTGSDTGVDPGGNVVVGHIAGKGLASLQQSEYFFRLLRAQGVPTHFISADIERQALTVRRAEWNGLEFIVRFKAVGSFVRRYGKFVQEGADLGCLVEITIKDDERGDPLINDEAIAALGILQPDHVRDAKALVKKAAQIIRDDLQAKGLALLDIKFECGLVEDELVIIDDISTDNMRITSNGDPVTPQRLLDYII